MVVEFLWTLRNGFRMRESIWRCLLFVQDIFFKDAALKRPGRYVCKKLRTLILPMYGYTIAYGLLVRLLHRWGFQIGGKFNLHNILISPLNDGHQFVLNMAGWYIVPLFMVEILNCMIRAFFKRKRMADTGMDIFLQGQYLLEWAAIFWRLWNIAPAGG